MKLMTWLFPFPFLAFTLDWWPDFPERDIWWVSDGEGCKWFPVRFKHHFCNQSQIFLHSPLRLSGPRRRLQAWHCFLAEHFTFTWHTFFAWVVFSSGCALETASLDVLVKEKRRNTLTRENGLLQVPDLWTMFQTQCNSFIFRSVVNPPMNLLDHFCTMSFLIF